MSSDSATILRDGSDEFRLQLTHRDWMLTGGPGFDEGQTFSDGFGIFDNYTIAGGIPKGSLVFRDGETLMRAATILQYAVRRDFELLSFDYSFKVGDEPKRYGGSRSISVGGRRGILSLVPKGYCSIKFVDHRSRPEGPVLLDLRPKKHFETDDGTIVVYRRKAVVRWLEILPPLLEFLSLRLAHTVSLEHIDRVA